MSATLSPHSEYEASKALELLSILSTEKARNDFVVRRGRS